VVVAGQFKERARLFGLLHEVPLVRSECLALVLIELGQAVPQVVECSGR
jgi:hypothetical protein